MLASLYNGNVHIWNHESQTLVKSFEVCDLPVRAGRFVPRKNWVITGSDDMQIRVFNYNTFERVNSFEAHSDYIRSIAVHPTQSFILTSSDDMSIKLWNWEKQWSCTQVFEGHTHYVMQIVINPKDNNTFASASLDRTIKVWQLGSNAPNFTLEGHEKGANCVDYYHGGDKPYLISGADDHCVKIWDYQNKTCVQTLEGHAQNISAVCFHPELPIIMTGSEDGTVRIWHANTYRLESTLNYGLERVWTIASLKGSNNVALGYDEGSILVKLGREEPAMSMDNSGKIIWAKHSEIQQANLKAITDTDAKDGERLPLAVKDMGSCEVYPQTISHNPNGRFVVVCGDGEYIIYTAMVLRNKSFGSAQEFVWAQDSSEYAIRENSSSVKLFKNFKEKKSFRPEFGAEGIYGGFMLGVRSSSGLAFYDWESLELVRRIEIQPKNVFWSETGELLCIASEDSYYVLKYNADKVAASQQTKEGITEDGIDEAFSALGEVQETVKTGIWVGDCFIYTNSVNRLNYYVGGEIVTISHLDRTMYLLGYIPKENRLYLGDKELNVVSFSLLLSVLEYQTAVMRRDFDTADTVLPTLPREQRTRVAHFLEKQGFKAQALAVSSDPEHRFELALQLGDMDVAYKIVKESQSEQKWKQLSELAISKCKFDLAQECLHQAQDYGGLLLLATASGNASMVQKLGDAADSSHQNQTAFLSYFILGKIVHPGDISKLAKFHACIMCELHVEKCLDVLIKTDRLSEATFFARTYVPSKVSEVSKLWQAQLTANGKNKIAKSIADPSQYQNLFPGLADSIKADHFLKSEYKQQKPASAYTSTLAISDRNPIAEMKAAEEAGLFSYSADTEDEDEEDEFDEACADIPGPSAKSTVESSENISSKDEDPTSPSNVEIPPMDAAAQIEEELDLDLDDLKIDESIDPADVNIDDLLSDD
ncbi:Coatomer subunit beta' [Nymphon striatum]|nr:Coatomer subunit beta' [Nymphon striatum]